MKNYSVEINFTEEESQKLTARALALNIGVRDYIKYCCLLDEDTTENPISFSSFTNRKQKKLLFSDKIKKAGH